MILLAYDGSPDAKAAIEVVARCSPAAAVTVVTVWEPFIQTLSRVGMGIGMGMGVTGGYAEADSESIDAAIREQAGETAAEGAQLATAAGLAARPRVARRDGDIAGAILRIAEEVDAGIVAVGTRGRGGVKAFLLGSVSHALVQRADRAVLVAPSPTVAVARRQHGDQHPVQA